MVRWVSGWNQQFAKLSCWVTGTPGSNPGLTAILSKANLYLKNQGFLYICRSKVSGWSAVRLAHRAQGEGHKFPSQKNLEMYRGVAQSG